VFEVATLVVGDFDATNVERDVIVEIQIWLLKCMSIFEPS